MTKMGTEEILLEVERDGINYGADMTPRDYQRAVPWATTLSDGIDLCHPVVYANGLAGPWLVLVDGERVGVWSEESGTVLVVSDEEF